MADENKEQEPENQVDLSGLGSFDFTPDWAKGKPADASRRPAFEPRYGPYFSTNARSIR